MRKRNEGTIVYKGIDKKTGKRKYKVIMIVDKYEVEGKVKYKK